MSKELDKAIQIASGDVNKDDIIHLEYLMRSGKDCEIDKFIKLIEGAKSRLKSRKKAKEQDPEDSSESE